MFQGGKKKQTKQVAKPVVAARPASKSPAAKQAPAGATAAAGAKRPRSANVIRVSDPQTDYSDNEEQASQVAMAVDDTLATSMKKELARGKRGLKPTPADAGVIYLGHIPHGFYEDQMKGFFSQFGTVSRLRLARNTKTGRSKHYAFIEFKHREVAEVVAKSMNGYLMFSKILACKLLTPEEVHPETFKNTHRSFRIVDRTAVARKNVNQVRTEQQAAKREGLLLAGESRKRRSSNRWASSTTLAGMRRVRRLNRSANAASRRWPQPVRAHQPRSRRRTQRSRLKPRL